MKKIIEGDIEDYLYSQCKEHGIMCIKQTGLNGIPDRNLVGFGYDVYVETKKPGEEPREDQIVIIERLRRRGKIVEIIDSKEQIDDLMKRFDEERKRFERKLKRGKKNDNKTSGKRI
jgi:hypothetical protein